MKVLMQNRPDAFINSGGDTIQMLETKRELEKLGIEIDISLELKPNLNGYDIVHLFNISRVNETWTQYKNAKSQNKPVIVSSIYHCKKEIREYEEQELFNNKNFLKKFFKNENLIELMKSCIRCKKSYKSIRTLKDQLRIGYKKQQKEIVLGCDMILPNSEKELKCMLEELEINKIIRNKIIPNGVSIIKDEKSENNLEKNIFEEKYIFCAGRIEPLKNQLRLIDSLKKIDIKIIFAGALNSKHKRYCKEFLKEVEKNKNVQYIGVLNKSEMNYVYKRAHITVMPSWFETTGLTGIESIFNGTPAIVTNRGYTKEYYGDYVKYCDPSNLSSIKEQLEIYKTYKENYTEFIKKINDEFNWKKAAELTKKAYVEVIFNEERK